MRLATRGLSRARAGTKSRRGAADCVELNTTIATPSAGDAQAPWSRPCPSPRCLFLPPAEPTPCPLFHLPDQQRPCETNQRLHLRTLYSNEQSWRLGAERDERA
ncbi:hypothetical protein DPSP01_013032 [Paraphaeosphaeria sporulosa]